MSYNSLFGGLYAQDTWKPRANITLTYGVRYDVYRPPDANENSPFEYSRKFRTDENNIAPRLGVAVGLGKTVVRASGGIFYDPFQTDLYRSALSTMERPPSLRSARSHNCRSRRRSPPSSPVCRRASLRLSRTSRLSARISQACIPGMRTCRSAEKLPETWRSRPHICSREATACP